MSKADTGKPSEVALKPPTHPQQTANQQPMSLSTFLAEVKYNTDGLIPAIAQQYDSGEVLMMAWMNQASIEETLTTHQVCYWSRSRQRFWRKGESSGQRQRLKSLSFDCDRDTLLLQVDQWGAACHTGRRHCFFYEVDGEQVSINSEPLVDPDILYGRSS